MNLQTLTAILLKWKWHLLAIFILSVVLTSVFSSSYFIKPLYKSEMLVFPANIAPVSDESETEQMLQYLQSADIRDSVIKQYNLDKHYEISPNYKFYKTALNNIWSERVHIAKTQYEGVKIEVKDTDPKMAYNICIAINKLYNDKINRIHDEKNIEVVAMLTRQLVSKGREIDSLKALYKEWCSGTELIGFEQQTNSKNNSIRNNEVYTFKNGVNANYDDFKVISNMIEGYSELYVKYRGELDMVKKQYNKNFTFSNIISHPEVADKKCYPVRWLMVGGVTVGVMFLTILSILFIDKRKIY